MGGHTKQISTAPKATEGLRNQVTDYLMGQTPGQIQARSPNQVQTNFENGINRGAVRDVNSQSTQTVDQLGGANSAFFQNMMAQLQPAFAQERAQGLASAKEAAGNLTGSGFANALGSSINRSLGNEQATLANYATQGLGLEMNRQQSDAQRQLQAQLANQSADQNVISQILQARGLGLQGQVANQNSQLATNQGNAQRFLQLLQGQSLAGVGPDTIQKSGGIGGFLGTIGGGLIGSALGPIGTAIGSKIGSHL